MSSIGSGPGISSGSQLEAGAVRSISTADSRATPSVDTSTAAVATTSTNASATAQSAAVVATTSFSAGSAPVDTDRVASIRKAIQSGNYPIIPTKIGDAMIAAGLMLRGAK